VSVHVSTSLRHLRGDFTTGESLQRRSSQGFIVANGQPVLVPFRKNKMTRDKILLLLCSRTKEEEEEDERKEDDEDVIDGERRRLFHVSSSSNSLVLVCVCVCA